ncbi:hypothetical protein HYH02_015174 [Chlamydomonas schloesseri]|uniref:Uncharacterized protein n=1 Tax=Chlamydomonas schloesseri TaxID=2026947 RepID=A0A835SLI2_9CHLO|nr:hypothetical protein HYH02_015174 [Chlamydomonas schloesseri]|eukprot:KAG2424504.1 hypothetical protein HYH02_015174 [Chlamydomonas schloesseri]
MPLTEGRRRQPHTAAATATAAGEGSGTGADPQQQQQPQQQPQPLLSHHRPLGGQPRATGNRAGAEDSIRSRGFPGRRRSTSSSRPGATGGGGGGGGVGGGGRRSLASAFGAAAVSTVACALLLCGALLALVPTPTTAAAPAAAAAAAPAAAAAAAAAAAGAAGGGGLGVGALSRAAAALQGAPLDPGGAVPVELNPSVMVLGEFDWVPYQAAPPFTSRCSDMVDRAKRAAGGSRVNFVPTHYWKDRNEDGSIDSFCYMDSTMTCLNHDGASVASFRRGMELCFRRAVEEGLGLSVVPHLDDGGKTAAWRNGLVFNPKKPYGGLSYAQVMLEPLVDALAAALAAKPDWVAPLPVWLALQGEMSATVLRYPHEYTQLLSELKERLLRGMRAAGASAEAVAAQRALTQVGVSFNFNKVLQVNTGGGAGGGSAASVLSRFLGFGPFAAATSSLTSFMGRGLRAAPAQRQGEVHRPLVVEGQREGQREGQEGEERTGPAQYPCDGVPVTTHARDRGVQGGREPAHPPPAQQQVQSSHPVGPQAPPPARPPRRRGDTQSAAATAAGVAPPRIEAASSADAADDDDGEGAAPRRRRALLQAAAAAKAPATASAAAAAAAATAAAGPASSVAKIDILALGALFEAIDFLGISAYAALDDPDFPVTALQNAAFTYFGEMRDQVGLDVAAILRRRNLDLHYSEFGMGGGSSPLGTTPARTPQAAARMPFYGVWGAYEGPGSDPWAPSQMRSFLHSFFAKTLSWLSVGGGPTYKISHCFLWGMGSWDVLGIYPESTTPTGSYRDPALVKAVNAHNARAAALAPAAAAARAGSSSSSSSTATASMQAYSDSTAKQQAGK